MTTTIRNSFGRRASVSRLASIVQPLFSYIRDGRAPDPLLLYAPHGSPCVGVRTENRREPVLVNPR